MTYELTTSGLAYFDRTTIEKIIDLPLVKRHLSVHNYFQCRDGGSPTRRFRRDISKKSVGLVNAILSFEVLQKEPIVEILQYISVEEIRKVYQQIYGEYFTLFESKLRASQNTEYLSGDILFPVLDLAREEKLIMLLQASMSTPLQAYTHVMLEQDFLLQEIESELTYHAFEAQKFIAAIQEDDDKYKQTVINIAFSVIRMGLGILHADELLTVSRALADLASKAFDKIEDKFSSIVSEIQRLVMNTHSQVLQDAEKSLLSTTSAQDIRRRWTQYRAYIFKSADQAIKHILDTCVNNNDFFRCVIRETIHQHKELTDDTLLLHAKEKARGYIINIVQGLQSQVARIQQIRDAILSREGSQKIECYFRRMCLINYAMSHEKPGKMTENWLTKQFGHRLSLYFPEVFQKKWSPVKLQSLFKNNVKYCKKKMTIEEYKKRREDSTVVLGLFRNSSRVREDLFAHLEEQIPHLSDQLVEELQQESFFAHSEDTEFMHDAFGTIGKARYSFKQRRLSIFGPNASPHSVKTTQQSGQEIESPVTLVSQRSLDDAR